MSRARSIWPEPWIRLQWAPHDHTRLARLDTLRLRPQDRAFVDDMKQEPTATLQQVAWLRSLARRYKVDPQRGVKTEASSKLGVRSIVVED